MHVCSVRVHQSIYSDSIKCFLLYNFWFIAQKALPPFSKPNGDRWLLCHLKWNFWFESFVEFEFCMLCNCHLCFMWILKSNRFTLLCQCSFDRSFLLKKKSPKWKCKCNAKTWEFVLKFGHNLNGNLDSSIARLWTVDVAIQLLCKKQKLILFAFIQFWWCVSNGWLECGVIGIVVSSKSNARCQ